MESWALGLSLSPKPFGVVACGLRRLGLFVLGGLGIQNFGPRVWEFVQGLGGVATWR